MMLNKIGYIDENPVKRGYVDEASHWRYSFARNYDGILGLIEVERFCDRSSRMHSQRGGIGTSKSEAAIPL
ncbi:hypothetical protein [Sulfurovum sp.]|uniref:hypothetical protein n=1 Tax=Sulfurovum sp. TaxID=1969726 RepID=UPI0025FD9151|nr:hypothetical protein [Sulfurovum sp.]